MSIFKAYIDYIKDNPKGYWFKAKLYGFGWVPARWQGWVVMLAFIAFLLWNGMTLGDTPTETELTSFFIKLGVAIFVILAICWRTGERPHWNWGLSRKDSETK